MRVDPDVVNPVADAVSDPATDPVTDPVTDPMTDPATNLDTSFTWQVAAASVCGTSHQRHGLPCQDAHAWEILPSGAIVIAVADGAGSALHSDRGSSIAVQTALNSLRDQADEWLSELKNLDHSEPDVSKADPSESLETERDPEPVIPSKTPSDKSWFKPEAHSLFDQVLRALKTEAEQENWSIADVATTLLVVVADHCAAIAIQVGDGAVILNHHHNGDEQTIALTVPSNGEYANETTFVTSQTARETLQIQTWKGDLGHLAVMTDGLQRLALSFPDAIPHQPFFRPLFQFVTQTADTTLANSKLADFLTSPRVSDRADDDLTLFLACAQRRPA